MPDIQFFESIAASDAPQVGGKGASLGVMAAAGLPVPAGFVVTTDAYRRLHASGLRTDSQFVAALLAAYQKLGAGPVAVRSSATSEDAADTSFAGQQDTSLGVVGEDALLNAIERCWKSLHTERATAYRAKQGVADSGLAMAVVVQKLVNADVAGVLFTRDPLDPAGPRMLAEASWGLGEAVVSGRVTPDRFHLEFETGRVLDRQLGAKTFRITATGEEAVPPELQQQFCLDDNALSQLADLGRKVEAFYASPRDVEWAYANGTFHLLQARPITVATAAERETIRREIIAELKAKADPRGTVWARYNLSEVLPAPTPMTWAVVGALLGANGGFGNMYRSLGMNPDPALGSLSTFDLVAGRPMVNLSRMPRMQSADPIFEYPFATFKANPRKALDPEPVLNPMKGGFLRGVLKLPGRMMALSRSAAAMKKAQAGFNGAFQAAIAEFPKAVQSAHAYDWNTFDTPIVISECNSWIRVTLHGFAVESLKPTVFAQQAWSSLLQLLTPKLGTERARAAVGELSLGAKPPPEADMATGVSDLAAGRIDRAAFLALFGHRGPNEMELAQPRWSETPEALDKIVGTAKPHSAHGSGTEWDTIAKEAKLLAPHRDQGAVLVRDLRTFLGLREAGKHYLLMGYAVIRRALVELDRRFHLNGGIFFLTPSDLPALLAGADLTAKIAAARKRRQAELSLEVPPVLFSDDLDAIGRPAPEVVGASKLDGVPLSAGVAEGPALVLREPIAPPAEGGYVLVCPSTDPAWVPLFVNAKALVMETGGVLSHGAIVAREFGLPAVAGLPDATKQIRNGQVVRVDGGRGSVAIL
jgi:phosphohistidine swiveling domain-containing protein